MKYKKLMSKLVLLYGFMPAMALAVDWTTPVTINGFSSVRYSQSDEVVFYNNIEKSDGINDSGSLWGTKAGINFHKSFTPNVNVVAQFVAAVHDDEITPRLDWAFGAMTLSKSFTLRLGKIKFPIGLVNEYIDVGLAYPWLQPPEVIYSLSGEGPLATREGFVGSSMLMEKSFDDWSLGADIFGGYVDMTGLTIKDMSGLTLRATYQDGMLFQASHYRGIVRADDPMSEIGLLMDKKSRSTSLVGTRIHWENFVAYAEYAKVSMNDLVVNFTTGGGAGTTGTGSVTGMGGVVGGVTTPIRSGNSSSWYTTLGYRIDKWVPHYTHQYWRRTSGNGQDIDSVGLNYDYSHAITLKTTLSKIDTHRNGLFGNYDSNSDRIISTPPEKNSATLWSVGVDMVW